MSFDSIVCVYFCVGMISFPWMSIAMALYVNHGEDPATGLKIIVDSHSNIELLIGFFIMIILWPLVLLGTVKGMFQREKARELVNTQETDE